MKDAIKKVVEGQDLSIEEAKRVMSIMLSGEATQAQLGSFLTALRIKGETLDEIIGCASVLGEKADHIAPKCENYMDFVGTGGDCTYSFNISTVSAFVASGAGVSIAKHGNRSISSKSGAADVLEALGVKIVADDAKDVERAVEEVGIGFMFAQTFNKSMKYVGQARNDMGIRTIFNILGPLANPSGAKHMLLGVFSKDLTEVIARAMKEMGVVSAFVVNAEDGMDEISTASDTYVSEIIDGEIRNHILTPEEFGFKRVSIDDLRGGDAARNAEIAKEILSGVKTPGRDVVLLNAGAAIYVAKKAASIKEGIEMAEASIDTGAAMKKLEDLVAFTNKDV